MLKTQIILGVVANTLAIIVASALLFRGDFLVAVVILSYAITEVIGLTAQISSREQNVYIHDHSMFNHEGYNEEGNEEREKTSKRDDSSDSSLS